MRVWHKRAAAAVLAAVGALGASGIGLPTASASAPAATAALIARSVRRYAPSWSDDWRYSTSNTATRYRVGLAHGGTAYTGNQYSSGWFQITTGPSAGSWLSTVSARATTTPIGYDTARWTGVTAYDKAHPAGLSSTVTGVTLPLTPLVGDYYANGWFQQRTGTGAGTWYNTTIPSNPYNVYETQEWRDTGSRALAPTSVTVTRYVVSNLDVAHAHSIRALSPASVVALIPNLTAVVGHYENAHWFHIDVGPYAGTYLNSGVLFTTADQSVMNGKLKPGDLCVVPTAMREVYNLHDEYLGCEPLQRLIALDAVIAAHTGLHVREWQAYRDYATQVLYRKELGPLAAIPGTSNHGLGNAIDLHYPGIVLTFTSAQVEAFETYGPAFGWTKPAHLTATGSNPEAWHFEFTG